MTKSGNHHYDRAAAWLPRAMRVEQGAAYLSISRSLFLKLVEEEVLPQPTKVPGHDVTTWDRFDLDAAYEDWKTGSKPSENTVQRRLRELRDARIKGEQD
jgi:predicted DNA-binding transcriptional regulator AlpA